MNCQIQETRSTIEEAGDVVDYRQFQTRLVEKSIKDKENWINFFERKLESEKADAD